MLSPEEIMQLIGSLIWLLAGVGVFIVGMNFMGDALEKSAGSGMKKLLEKISNNRLSGVGIGAGVTAIIQSSSATSVMVIGLVNAGVMTLMQATPMYICGSHSDYKTQKEDTTEKVASSFIIRKITALQYCFPLPELPLQVLPLPELPLQVLRAAARE